VLGPGRLFDGRGIGYAQTLREFMRPDPMIVKAHDTLGTFQHFMRIMETETYGIRNSCCENRTC